MVVLRGVLLALTFVSGLAGAALAETVLHRGNSKEPDSLDPHRAAGVWENEIIGDMFLGLTTEAANGDIVPGSAKSWTISDDGLVYTFTLRDNLYWSDGVQVTASDFVFGMRRIMDPATAARYASLLFPIKNAHAINTGKMNPDAIGVVALDSKTVEITLESPVPFFTQLLAHYTTYPIPQHAFAVHGEDWVKAGNMVTNGAYVLQEWVTNSHVKVSKNPKFYDAANVAIDTVFYYPIEDSRTGLKMFETGELHTNLMTAGFPSTMLEDVTQRLPDEARVVPSLGNRFLPMNTSKPPFNDKRVRKAVSMLVDREIINDRIVSVGARSAYAFVPPETANHQAGAQVDFVSMAMPDRIAEAKRLLAEVGYSVDNPLRFELSYRAGYDQTRRLSAVAAMFRRAGVIAEIAAYDSRISYSKMDQGDYEMGDGGWHADYNDPYNFLYLLLCDSGPMNWARYCNPEFDALVNEAARTLDMKKRAGLMSQAEQIMLDDHPVIMLDYATNRILVSKRIRGFVDNISNAHRTRYLSFVDE
ncbi:MAG: peptide ABC transporter substrate-binding protein [Rhodospirillaceae bacterium]|nr:peptide ABC transporter substrate-binding protein [Rhodospirillaceae bacterium]MBT6091161.1 peptide ABC transporter substrate-binding protein [Rhodospirillaceae bacterium]MBT7451525.1 peptide ABC transporter substrate-binding protein [Rhodospirillaceae bacterium]